MHRTARLTAPGLGQECRRRVGGHGLLTSGGLAILRSGSEGGIEKSEGVVVLVAGVIGSILSTVKKRRMVGRYEVGGGKNKERDALVLVKVHLYGARPRRSSKSFFTERGRAGVHVLVSAGAALHYNGDQGTIRYVHYSRNAYLTVPTDRN